MTNIRTWIVGYNPNKGKVYIYKTEEEAEQECNVYKQVEGETAKDAKETFQQYYDVYVNGIGDILD